tara:strand:- start:1638 stop:2852 length:1215 start_codon:yes stop_codon:yes gene_type:complete
MELQLFGINHKTSKLSERELFIINDSNQDDFLNFFKEEFGHFVESFFALSTCNRTEIYYFGEPGTSISIAQKTLEFLGCNDSVRRGLYFFDGEEAIQHMCSVASGLDSQVLGEQEILGQFKKSAHIYTKLGTLNSQLLKITNEIISIAKAARTETKVGFNPLSVSGLSLKIVQEIFEDPSQQKLTIVGAGQMAMNVIGNFYDNGIKNIHAVNRSKKFLQINDSFSLVTSNLSKLATLIQTTDILVTSVNSPLPVIGKGLIEDAMRLRANKPMLLIDLGVPRNVEDQVRDLEYAYLFTIEDIELVTQENLEERSVEAIKAKQIIKDRVRLLTYDQTKKRYRSEAYEALKVISSSLNEQDYFELLSSDDPYKFLESKDMVSIKKLNQISALNSHAIFSMLKEIRSA